MFRNGVFWGALTLLFSMVTLTRGLPSGFIAEGEIDMILFSSVVISSWFLVLSFSQLFPLIEWNSPFG